MILQAPNIAARSCSDCQKYLYYDRGSNDFGDQVKRGGNPVFRPKGVKTPCGWCPKIPIGAEPKPSNAIEMSAKSYAALAFHRECEAVHEFPADAIVRRNAAIIRAVESSVERVLQARNGAALMATIRGRGE